MVRMYLRVAVFLAAASAPSLAQAQLVSTGVEQTGGRDERWEVSNSGGTSWTQAYVISPVPFQWTNGAPGGTWIGATSTGSGGGGNYRIRSQFSLGAGDTFSFDFRCAIDDTFLGLFINGTQFGSNHCSTIHVWGSFVSVGAPSFQAGLNSVEFRWSGNNTTDGIAVELKDLRLVPGASVPEPSTVALLASGLLGVGVVARRRRLG